MNWDNAATDFLYGRECIRNIDWQSLKWLRWTKDQWQKKDKCTRFAQIMEVMRLLIEYSPTNWTYYVIFGQLICQLETWLIKIYKQNPRRLSISHAKALFFLLRVTAATSWFLDTTLFSYAIKPIYFSTSYAGQHLANKVKRLRCHLLTDDGECSISSCIARGSSHTKVSLTASKHTIFSWNYVI